MRIICPFSNMILLSSMATTDATERSPSNVAKSNALTRFPFRRMTE